MTKPYAVNAFVAARPYLYHLTASANLPFLRADRRLQSAALLRAAGRDSLARTKREEMLPLTIGDRIAVLRDQSPLYPGNVALADGWTFDDLLADLNRRVFFWPGAADAPIDYGRRHFARYAAPDHPYVSAVLRIPFASLLAANSDNAPLFSRYNSGSPRRNKGQPIPRGPETFRYAADFPHPPGHMVEVTFVDAVALPADTALCALPGGYRDTDHLHGPWSPLFA